jgi:hypothetical protein
MPNDEKDIEYYYKNNRFLKLFLETKKYKDILLSKEAFFSLAFSILISTLLIINLDLAHANTQPNEFQEFMSSIKSIILTILGGFFSLLGFTIGGLALLTGTIGKNVIIRINQKKKIDSLISIIFNFYFSGMLNGLSVFILIIDYIIILFPKQINFTLFIVMTTFSSYLVIFSILYSVLLLGTCIRIFLLRFYYENEEN